MNPALARLNALPAEAARAELLRCCGAKAWADAVLKARPFADEAALYAAGEAAFRAFARQDWLEAFAAHPRIGDAASLKAKFAETAAWAGGEQAGAARAPEGVLAELAALNEEFSRKFGHIFIVCATGKSAAEMLSLLKERLKNDAPKEACAAAGEQIKITRLRLEKLLKEAR